MPAGRDCSGSSCRRAMGSRASRSRCVGRAASRRSAAAHGLGGHTNPGLGLARRRAVATTGCERVRGLQVIVGMASRAGTLVAALRAGGHEQLRAGRGLLEHPRADPAWTSTNGTDSTVQPGLDLALPANGDMPHLVAGPAGFLAVAPGPADLASPTTAASSLMVSPGRRSPSAPSRPASSWLTWPRPRRATWRSAPTTDPDHHDAATLWSTDGRHWSSASMQVAWEGAPRWPPRGRAPSPWRWSPARNGFIVTGGTGGAPGAALWWQSDDGQHWRQLSGYPPLGAWPGEGEGAGGQPYGVLLGDGQRIIAVRGGPDAGPGVRRDGRTWTKLVVIRR